MSYQEKVRILEHCNTTRYRIYKIRIEPFLSRVVYAKARYSVIALSPFISILRALALLGKLVISLAPYLIEILLTLPLNE